MGKFLPTLSSVDGHQRPHFGRSVCLGKPTCLLRGSFSPASAPSCPPQGHGLSPPPFPAMAGSPAGRSPRWLSAHQGILRWTPFLPHLTPLPPPPKSPSCLQSSLGVCCWRTQPQTDPSTCRVSPTAHTGVLRPSSTLAGSRHLVGDRQRRPVSPWDRGQSPDLAASLHRHFLSGWMEPLALSTRIWRPKAASQDAGHLPSHLFVCFPTKQTKCSDLKRGINLFASLS